MSTLNQRIDNFLRGSAPPSEMIVEEVDANEYLLQKAEGEIRAAQERLEKLKRDIAEGVSTTLEAD